VFSEHYIREFHGQLPIWGGYPVCGPISHWPGKYIWVRFLLELLRGQHKRRRIAHLIEETINRYQEPLESFVPNIREEICVLLVSCLSTGQILCNSWGNGEEITTKEIDWVLLGLAALRGDIELLNYLLSHGIRVPGHHFTHLDVVIIAARQGHTEVAFRMVCDLEEQYGQKLYQSQYFETMTESLVVNQNYSFLEQLWMRAEIFNTPIVKIVMLRFALLMNRGGHDLLKFAIEQGADVNAGTYESWFDTLPPTRRPLELAVENQDAEALKILLEAGATQGFGRFQPAHGFDYNTTEPVWTAAKFGNIDCLKILIKYGAPLNKTEGEEPLECALVGGKLEAAQLLLDSGADLFYDNIHVRSLHRAIDARDEQCVRFLIAAGVDPNTEDKWGNRPLLSAMSHYKDNIMNFLKEHGAVTKEGNPKHTNRYEFGMDRWHELQMRYPRLQNEAHIHIEPIELVSEVYPSKVFDNWAEYEPWIQDPLSKG
jgi:ankyrin repeat protein